MLLKLENVKKTYGSFELDCTMEIKRGQVTGLIGRNGAGKSTTFKSVLGLVFPDGGSIEMFGKKLSEITPEDKEKLGVVLAEANACEMFTPKDMLPVLKAMYKSFSERDYLDKCKEYGIPMDKPLKEFSTGMKAKFKIIMAMTHGARLLILDEPTAGLDVVMRTELLDMLREYMDDEENAILISSHIATDLEGLCDDIYMIADGRIVLHEETDVLLSEYGVLKVTEEQYEKLEKEYVLATKKEKFGYLCLTNRKDFYQENYPQIAIEKGNIDDLIMMLGKGGRK